MHRRGRHLWRHLLAVVPGAGHGRRGAPVSGFTDEEAKETRRALMRALGRAGGLKGGKATGASKVRGDADHYRRIRTPKVPV